MTDKPITRLHAIAGGGSAVDISREMCDAVKEAIYRYDGRATVSMAIGVLEIAKFEIMHDAAEEY